MFVGHFLILLISIDIVKVWFCCEIVAIVNHEDNRESRNHISSGSKHFILSCVSWRSPELLAPISTRVICGWVRRSWSCALQGGDILVQGQEQALCIRWQICRWMTFDGNAIRESHHWTWTHPVFTDAGTISNRETTVSVKAWQRASSNIEAETIQC